MIKSGDLDGCYVDGILIRDGKRVERHIVTNTEISSFKELVASEFENQILKFNNDMPKTDGKGIK